MTQTDRIEKQIVLHAPRSRVFRALTVAEEFGSWFGMKFEGAFAPGAVMRGIIFPTTVDEHVAELQKPMEGTPFEFRIDRIEPEHYFSFRWHPSAVDRSKNYANEPMTLVTFELSDTPSGVLLKVTESGFDNIPLERRATAFANNDEGWAHQVKLIEKYLARAS
jgi:uncharacterized protein YndB with AHSA1/START domain